MTALDTGELRRALALAERAAVAAGEVALGYFRSPELETETKGDGSPVTTGDREAERTLRDVLAASPRFGDLDVLGEETGLEGEGSRLRWIVDPIDGTLSYSRGIPLFGTMVALVDTETEESLVGVTHLPALDRTISAARGQGCTVDGKPARIRQDRELADAMISIGDPHWYRLGGLEAAWKELLDTQPWVRGYTDCFGHLMLLSGGTSVIFDTGYRSWDLAAFAVQVPEAGGALRTRPTSGQDTSDVLAGAPALVEELGGRLDFPARPPV